MARKKVTLAYIEVDSERKASLRKRKRGLMNKAREIGTLCDVPVCVIVYSPFDEEAEVYPSRAEAQAVVGRFYRLSEAERTRKMVNQETFTQQRILKAQAQLSRLHREKRRRELEKYVYRCMGGSARIEDVEASDVKEIGWVINEVLRDITSRMEKVKGKAKEEENEEETEEKEEDRLNSYMLSIADSLTELQRIGSSRDEVGWDLSALAYPYMFNNAQGSGGQQR
ncbi:MADS-box transcription factor family protein [Striga asiatica]|uniref:MADS-box transcription factor family protein n=1 Tax=Striga asiatica TaxID=4170 RepID=A0A5A7RKS5_STRAF|nr:MADS-box transcription factor family protein [Striga asiatica]